MSSKKSKKQDGGNASRKQWDVKKLGKIQAAKIVVPAGGKKEAKAQTAIEWKLLGALLVGLAILAFMPHAVTLTGGLVFHDKPTLQAVTQFQNSGQMWSHTCKAFLSGLYEQPWVSASYYLDGQKYLDRFEWWHLVNLSLHVLTSVYLYLLVFRVSWNLKLQDRLSVNPYWLAFFAGSIFACHPLVTQSVAYLSGRWALLVAVNYLLACNFFLVAFLAQGIGARFWGYVSTLVFALMALGSGLEAASLPLTLLALALILKKPDVSWTEYVRLRPALYIVLALASGGVAASLVSGADRSYAFCPNSAGWLDLSPLAYYATQFKALLSYYLRCAIVPLGLALDPPLVRADSFADPLSLLGVAVVLGAAWCWWQKRSNGVICLGLTLFFAGIALHMLVPQKEVVADTVMYLPLTGLAVLLANFLGRLAATNFSRGVLVFGCTIAILGALAMWRDYEYGSELRLLEAAVRANQASAFAHAMLSLQLLREDKPQASETEALQAYTLDKRLPVVLIAKGQMDLAAGRYREAKAGLAEAVELCAKVGAPADLDKLAHLGLAEAYLRMQDNKRAAELALPYARFDMRASELCGLAALQDKNYERALIFLSMVVRQEPWRKECWLPIAQAAFALDMYDEALQAAKMAMAQTPTNETRLMLARAALACENLAEAKKPLMDLVEAHKADAEVYALMSYLQLHAGDKALADSYMKDALKLDPHARELVAWLGQTRAKRDARRKQMRENGTIQ